MRIGIMSDIHSNLEALTEALAALRAATARTASCASATWSDTARA